METNSSPVNPVSYYSGLSGLQLPVPKYMFPPEYQDVSRLTYYSTFFNSIEINSSFYKVPLPATVKKWADMVPENFIFTFKFWQQVTHTKYLNFDKSDVETFLKSVGNIGHKKGCLLIQLPPSSGIENITELEKLLQCISELNEQSPWKIAVEFRNKSWYHEKVYNLLEIYKATLVIQDIPKSATPFLEQRSDFIYVRFHGPTGNYRESYSEEFLSDYASFVAEWLEEGKSVYVYFNNTMGDAFNNLKVLNQLVYNRV